VAVLWALRAAPCSCSIAPVLRQRQGRRDRQVVSAQGLAASVEPHGVPATLSLPQALRAPGSCYREMLVPPRPAAKEVLHPIALR